MDETLSKPYVEARGITPVSTIYRVAIILILGSLTSIAGWWTLFLRSEIKGSEIALAVSQEQVKTLEQDLESGQARMRVMDEELQTRARQITTLTAELAESESLRKQSEAARLLLKVNHRAARLEVIEQGPDPADPQKTLTRVRFIELDAGGNPIGPSQEFTVEGTRVYLESLVIKFDDTFVEGGDALRGTSVCIFSKMFGENTPAAKGQPIDTVGQRPHPYAQGDTIDPWFDELWGSFWDYANDPEAAAKKGVRAMHGEAPWVEARPGGRYSVDLRSSGGLTITAN